MIVIFAFSFPQTAFAQEDIISQQLDNLDVSDIDQFIKDLNNKYGEIMPEQNIRQLIDRLRSEKSFDFRSFFKTLALYIFREISANFHLLGQLIALSVVCAILKNINEAFENGSVSKITYSVVFLVLIIIAVQSFTMAIRAGQEAISDMVSFIQALMPTIFTLLVSIGNLTSVAVFNPLIFMGITAASTWIKDILLPIIFFSAVLGVVNNVTDRFKVSMLASLLKQVCVFLLGLFLSIFLGVLVVQGAASAAVDGISIRTAKFASKNFIPIVGGIFSDTIDAIVGCSLILKNAIGITGMLVVLFITIYPIIKILAIVFIYKLAGAIIQPIGESSMVKCLDDMANSLILIFISVAAVAMMFFMAITVILASGNITVMMR